MSLLEEAQELTNDIQDQNEVATGFDRVIAQEGTGVARLVSYVELGTRMQTYEGKDTKPALEVRLGFEFLDKKHLREIEVDGVKKTIGTMHYENLTIKLNEKASYYLLFKKLQQGLDVKNMVGLLNKAFIFKVEHNKSKDGKATYANIRNKLEGWLVLPSIIDKYNDDDEVTGTRDRTEKCIPATQALQMFVVERPSVAQWDSVYIPGTYTKKVKSEDGTLVEKEVSKNWIQNKIQDATDWKGSAMEALLLDLDVDATPEVAKDETSKKSKTTKKTKAKVVEDDTDAMLAEMGM